MTNTQPFPLPERSPLDRALALFSKVQAGEGLTAILLAANVFILLGTYYILKTVREPLILGQPGGAEVKSYASAGQAVLFLLVVPLYGMVASRFDRVKLVGGVTAFFISNLALFYVLGSAGVSIGVAYFLWVGIFNMLVVAQFWAFANDVYTEEQGKRLFPIVGVGASLGAWVGSEVTKQVYAALGAFNLMLLAAVLLGACIALTAAVHNRQRGHAAAAAQAPLDRKGGFQLVIKDKYLRLIALMVLVFNCVNTVGEYLVSRFVTEQAATLAKAEADVFIGQFYGDYYRLVNLVGFFIQTFAVSRLLKWIGVRGALFILPVIALGGYGMLATLPLLGVIRIAKILENATDYSLNNTVRHALYLPTSREAKYKAKAATDTFFVRTGDMIQAGIVAAGVAVGFSVKAFALVNIALVGVWLVLALGIHREHQRVSNER